MFNQQNKTHHRTTYTWLETEVINENTFLFCEICRNRSGNTKFALGTTDLSLEGIKRHLNTNEHSRNFLTQMIVN